MVGYEMYKSLLSVPIDGPLSSVHPLRPIVLFLFCACVSKVSQPCVAGDCEVVIGALYVGRLMAGLTK
jgi:hypothetical protein